MSYFALGFLKLLFESALGVFLAFHVFEIRFLGRGEIPDCGSSGIGLPGNVHAPLLCVDFDSTGKTERIIPPCPIRI